MNVLILGGTGWLGHQVARRFAAAGHRVVIASRGRKNAFTAAVSDLEMLTVDQNDPAALAAMLDRAECEIVVAVVPTRAAIEVLARYPGLVHYLHCSSTGGYAPLPRIPGDETLPYRGYPHGGGWTQKAEVDGLALELHRRRGFPATVLRPCCILGPGMPPVDNFGGRDPGFVAALQAGREIELADGGLALIQPVWLTDLAAAFVAAAACREAACGEVFNVTCDYSVTLARYCEIAAEALGQQAHIRAVPLAAMLEKYAGRCNEVGLRFLAEHMCFVNHKIRQRLAWHPEYSAEAAIAATVRAAVKEL